MFSSRAHAAGVAVVPRFWRAGSARTPIRSVLQGQASRAADQLRGRRPRRHRGPAVRQAFGKHIDGAPNIIVQNRDGAGGLVGTNYLGELGPRDGTMAGYLTAAAWNYVIDPALLSGRLLDLRVHRLPAGERRLLHARRHAARHEGRRRPHAATGLVAGGLAAEFLEGPADPAHARHARRAVQIRHRLPFERAGAARAAARRDQFLLEILAELFRRGRAVAGEERAGDRGLVRPDLRRQQLRARSSRWRARGCRAFPSSIARSRARRRRAGSGTSTAPISRSIPRCCARWCCRRACRRPRSTRCARAIERLNGDAEFAKEAQKSLQFVPHYVTGGDLNARVRRTLVVRPEIRAFVTDYIKNPPK